MHACIVLSGGRGGGGGGVLLLFINNTTEVEVKVSFFSSCFRDQYGIHLRISRLRNVRGIEINKHNTSGTE